MSALPQPPATDRKSGTIRPTHDEIEAAATSIAHWFDQDIDNWFRECAKAALMEAAKKARPGT